jgi:O-acetylserine/cysteine efflux transporter
MALALAGLMLIAADLDTGGPVGAFLLVVSAAFFWGAGNIAVTHARHAPPSVVGVQVNVQSY